MTEEEIEKKVLELDKKLKECQRQSALHEENARNNKEAGQQWENSYYKVKKNHDKIFEKLKNILSTYC